MKVTICSNTETLRSLWEDVFTCAGFEADSWSEEVAAEWLDVMHKAVMDLGFDYDYDRNFAHWHGGPYSGVYHNNRVSTAPDLEAARAKANCAARAKAEEWLAFLVGEREADRAEDET